MMMINDNNAGCAGGVTPTTLDYINNQKMTRFILRSTAAAAMADACDGSVVPGRGGYKVTPEQLATYANAVQELAEKTRLGIPVVFKDNARNHIETDPRQGIGAGSGAFTQFPKEARPCRGRAGRAVRKGRQGDHRRHDGDQDFHGSDGHRVQRHRPAGDVRLHGRPLHRAAVVPRPRDIYRRRGPRHRHHERSWSTCRAGPGGRGDDAVALTIKHFPGGGPQQLGLDPHFTFGKNQVYPAGRFADHLKPFRAAIDAGVSSVMPYYGVPIDGARRRQEPDPADLEGTTYALIGIAFSRPIVTDFSAAAGIQGLRQFRHRRHH